MILDHQKRYTENRERFEALQRQKANLMINPLSQNIMRRQNQATTQMAAEIEAKERELYQEASELAGSMDDRVKQAIVDYLNLVFGAGQETEDFWNTILLPYASQYFSYPFDDLQRSPKFLNAIFFGFSEHFGIKIGKPVMQTDGKRQMPPQKEDEYFKDFGKSEMPFGPPHLSYTRIQLVGRVRTYGLRTLSYKLLADKYREYRQEGRIENALKCCKMKRVMKRLLEGQIRGGRNDDVATIADICEIALDNGEYKIAKEQAVQGLKLMRSPLHAEAIKFYCILMRSFYGMDFTQEADQYFSKALATLDHHWGPFHPLHSTIYGIMAHLLIQQGKMEEAKYLYQSSLICSLRVLGPNHIRTAEIHTDFGRLYLRMKNKDESLQHFEEAYLIYESYFGPTALPTARAAIQIAQILEEQKGKLNDALRYATIATEAFRDIYGEESEHTINAQFLALSISYSLKNPKIREQYEKLFEALMKRDRQFREDNSHAQIALPVSGRNGKDSDWLEERISEIKELCIAAMIMEMTRSLSLDDKQIIKSYCDRMLLREHQEKQQLISQKGNDDIILDDYNDLPSLAELHQRIDHMKISSLSALKFDDSGKKFLQQLYEETSQSVSFSSFSQYYKKILDDAINQVKEEQQKLRAQGAGALNQTTAKGNQGAPKNIDAYQFEIQIVGAGPKEFFLRVIKCFRETNFYNLLIL